MDDATANSLAKATAKLRQGANVHRRSANAHRRAARSMMHTLAELEAICEANRISLDITQIQEDQSK